ncbi:MAG: YdcF family protein [Patescibacteria group bacterium]
MENFESEQFKSEEEKQAALEYEKSIEQETKKPIDALVVFGFGIVSDQDLEKQAMGKEIIGKPEKSWRLPLGAKLRTMAAAKLFMDGQVGDVILTGGTVKQKEGINASEAQLMKDYFHHKLENWWTRDLKKEGRSDDEVANEIEARWQNTEPHVLLEDKATNTIENFAYTINFLEANRGKYQNTALLSNNFHIDRIVKLANKLGASGKGVGVEPVVSVIDERYQKIADNYFGHEKNQIYRQEVLKDLDEERQKIAEVRLGTSLLDYEKGEKRWSRGLDEIPEYWLPNVKFIKNPEQLKNILSAEENVQEVLRQHGIEDIDAADEGEIRQALEGIERKMPPKDWEEE